MFSLHCPRPRAASRLRLSGAAAPAIHRLQLDTRTPRAPVKEKTWQGAELCPYMA